MYRNTTIGADWRTLADMAAGRHVIQIGFGYGHDTAALSRTATSVTCVGQANGLEHEGFRSAADQWHETLVFKQLRSRVYYVNRDWHRLATYLVPESFGLAVIDLPALGEGQMPAAVGVGLYCSPHVVVHDAPGEGLDTMLPTVVPHGHRLIRSGMLHVLTPQTNPINEELMG